MVRVWAASRLHFGLLSLAGEAQAWPDREDRPTLPARRFGGVGLMVKRPGLCVWAADAATWSAEGPLAERALAFALRFADNVRKETPDAEPRPLRITVEEAPPEHVGLGVGTQLGLATARALAEAWGLAADAPELARRVGRGTRSALGVHGFAHGGFLVEGGRRGGEAGLAPLAARAPFPAEWRVVLATPPGARGLHGPEEREAFSRLASGPDGVARTDALCRLALLGMLPALAEADLEAFGECLFDFNARVGEVFRVVQGGVYADPRTAEFVDFLRREGIRGAGQSSWGPTAFAVVGDEGRASDLADRLAERFGLGPGEAWVTAACNTGSHVWRGG